MKWRMVDKVEAYAPWRAIVVTKVVSFEECSLLKVFGRKGEFPSSLLLESCVEAARWLAAASSDFTQACVLREVTAWALYPSSRPGQAYRITLEVDQRAASAFTAAGRITSGPAEIARGRLHLECVPLAEGFDPELVHGMWRELYAPA